MPISLRIYMGAHLSGTAAYGLSFIHSTFLGLLQSTDPFKNCLINSCGLSSILALIENGTKRTLGNWLYRYTEPENISSSVYRHCKSYQRASQQLRFLFCRLY